MTPESNLLADSKKSSLVSRRSVVRGAAVAARTVPAVTLATAAPAFAACSANLVHTSSSAAYLTGPEDPTRMNISFTFTNTGPSAAKNVQVQFNIPKSTSGYLVAPGVIGSISGGTAASTFTNNGANWSLPVTLTVPTIPSGQSRTVSMTIGFRDGSGNVIGTLTGFTWSDAPFRRWAGNAFTLNATATAANAGCGTVSRDIPVTATPNATFGGDNSNIDWYATSGNGAPVGKNGVRGAIWWGLDKLYQEGRSSVGQVTIIIEFDKQGSGRYSGGFEHDPYTYGDSATGQTKWDFISSNAGGGNGSNGDTKWQWEFRNKLAGWAPSTGRGGPSTDLDGPVDHSGNNYAFGWWTVPINTSGGTGFGGTGTRHFVISAPHATTANVNDGDW